MTLSSGKNAGAAVKVVLLRKLFENPSVIGQILTGWERSDTQIPQKYTSQDERSLH